MEMTIVAALLYIQIYTYHANIFRKVYIEITSMIFVCDADNGLQGGNCNARINEIIRYEYELMRQ